MIVWGLAIILHGLLILCFLVSTRNEMINTRPEYVSVVFIESSKPQTALKSIDDRPAKKSDQAKTVSPKPARNSISDEEPEALDISNEDKQMDIDLEKQPEPPKVLVIPGKANDIDKKAAPSAHIPSRWALKPPLAHSRLEGLGLSIGEIHCLQSLEEDCKTLRKEIFAEYQLTETEFVWTPNRADTGLPSQLYGLTDREIRSRLSIPNAGENGLFIPFTNIGIGGPIVDKMHGVNKACKLMPAIAPANSPNSGSLGVRRVCD